MIDILFWQKSDNEYIEVAALPYENSFIGIKEAKTNKHQLPENYYMAYINVNNQIFQIPGTEDLKCFDIGGCQKICQKYWTQYLQSSMFVAPPKMAPPAVEIDIAQA